jgi:hypothetical protein
MIGPSAVDEAVERIAARHDKRHVGLGVGAVTSAGARSVAAFGHVRAPDGPAPRADSLFEIGSVTNDQDQCGPEKTGA